MKKLRWTIYGLSVEGDARVVYVGITKSPQSRFRSHKASFFAKSLREAGLKLRIRILDEFEATKLDAMLREIYWIAKCADSHDLPMLNGNQTVYRFGDIDTVLKAKRESIEASRLATEKRRYLRSLLRAEERTTTSVDRRMAIVEQFIATPQSD